MGAADKPEPLLYTWMPAISMQLVCIISFVDRNTLALLAPTIMQQIHLSGQQYGYIISAFSIAYMVGNPVWGWIIDRFGLRRGMTVAVLLWTLASAAHALCTGFWGLFAARAALGFGEGATFPGGLRTVMQTLPGPKRGRGAAVAYSGGALGGFVTPLIVTPIYLWWGWPAAFWFTGGIGAAWLVFWRFLVRRPDLRQPPQKYRPVLPVPRLRDPELIAFIFLYALGALPMGLVIYEASVYFSQALGRSQAAIGAVLWLPALGWEAGYYFWGWLSDRWLSSGLPMTSMVRRVAVPAVVLSLLLALVPWLPGFGLPIAGMVLSMFMATGFVIVSLRYATHVYSVDRSGFIAGVGAGSWGAAVALVMPFFGRLFDQRRYGLAFLIAAVCPAIGYAGWAWMSSIAGRARLRALGPAAITT